MRVARVHAAIAAAGRLGVAVAFLTACSAKLTQVTVAGPTTLSGLDAFSWALHRHGVVPPGWEGRAAFAAVAAEGAGALWLLTHWRPRGGALFGAALLVAFSAYLALVYAKHGEVACACFGTPSSAAVREAMARNAGLMALLAATWVPAAWLGIKREA